MAYATEADAIPFLPAGGLPNPARVVEGSASGDYLVCEGHGLEEDAPVTFRAEAGGAVPIGLAEGTTYYAKIVSGSRFQVAATAGGAAINLTTDGSNFVFSTPLPWASWLEWADRMVDSFLPPHVTPIVSPYPALVVTAAAELAALRGLQAASGASIDLGARLDAIGARLTRWAKGVPVRGVDAQTTQPSFLAVTSAAGASDPRGWAGDDSTRIP